MLFSASARFQVSMESEDCRGNWYVKRQTFEERLFGAKRIDPPVAFHDILLTFYLPFIREIWWSLQENQVGQNNNNRKTGWFACIDFNRSPVLLRLSWKLTNSLLMSVSAAVPSSFLSFSDMFTFNMHTFPFRPLGPSLGPVYTLKMHEFDPDIIV